MAVMMGLGIIAPLMPLYAKNMGASGLWLGIIFSSYSLSRLIFVPMMGKMSDKNGRKKIIAIGLLLYSIFSLAYVFATNVYALTFVRFLQGFASAMTLPIIMAYIGDISPKGQEGKYMGYFNVSRFLGLGFGPFLGGVLNDFYGIDSAFYALSALTGFAFLLTLFYLQEEEGFLKEKKEKPKPSFKKLFQNRIMRGVMIFRFVSALGRGSIFAFLAIYAFSYGISALKVGIIIAANMLFMSFLQIPFGKMADRFSKLKIIVFSGFITVISLILMPFTGNFYLLLLLNILWGSGRAMGIPATIAINTIIGRKHGMGSSTAMFMTAMYAGMVVAPLISGVLMETIGIRFVFIFAGISALAGVLIFYFLVRSTDLNHAADYISKREKTHEVVE